jgi:hypothetical protein
MPLKIFVYRADRHREGCTFVIDVNEMTSICGETVRCFESKERLPKSVCYISFYGTSKTPENVEYFRYFGSVITNDARCTRAIKSRVAVAKSTFNEEKNLFSSKLDLI